MGPIMGYPLGAVGVYRGHILGISVAQQLASWNWIRPFLSQKTTPPRLPYVGAPERANESTVLFFTTICARRAVSVLVERRVNETPTFVLLV